MIPHAGGLSALALAAVPFPIAVVEPALGALTMAAASTPQALAAGLGRASRAAVDVTPVAAAADGEGGHAARASRQA